MSTRLLRFTRENVCWVALGCSLLLMLMHQPVAAVEPEGAWEPVSGATVVQGSRVYARGIGYYTDNTVSLGGASPTGPLRIVVTSSTLTVTNGDGTDDSGNPVFMLGSASDTTRIYFALRRARFGYTTELQQFVEDTGPTDTDEDGIPDDEDNCPNDANPDQADADGDGIGDVCDPVNDIDNDLDGVNNDVDNCPLIPNPDQADLDNDGIGDVCDLVDDTDSDGDGVRDEIDNCPNDPNPDQADMDDDDIGDVCDPVDDRDEDEDGIPDSEDICPEDDTNSCITITGEVFGAGATIFQADVKIGTNTVETSTDPAGGFTAGVGNGETGANAAGTFFPIEVSAPGFSTGNVKVNYFPGVTEYQIDITLVEVSTVVEDDDDLNEGVDIIGDGEPVGSLMIPTASLPAGVTQITGNVTYLDPLTNDINSGPDLLAAPAGSDPNEDTPVTLETFGMMEFDLVDQNGQPISELDGPAQVCMAATPGLVAGEIVPLWYYDEEAGLWIEEGQGTVVNVDGQLQICGEVMHFTWWNYDRPIETHSCFKFQMLDADTGLPLTGIAWYAEGITYNGTSPNRYCSDTPAGFDSLTVKRSEGGVTEQIRVYGLISGIRYYLHREGADDYALKSAAAGAEVFDNPTDQGSCLSGTRSGFCENLDYADDNNAILRISSDINLPPVISEFSLGDNVLIVDESTNAMATVTDPEGTDVSVEWEAQCYNGDSGSISPPVDGPSSSGATFNALFTAPSSLNSLFEYCDVRLTATDADGNTATAQRYLTVVANTDFRFSGQVFGTDGLPAAFHPVDYFNYCNGDQISDSGFTDSNGFFEIFVDLGPCGFGEGFFFGDLGALQVPYTNNGDAWQRYTQIDDYGYYGEYGGEFGPNCFTAPDGVTECFVEVYLPTLWTDLMCTFHRTDAPEQLVDFGHTGLYGGLIGEDSFFGGFVSGPPGTYDVCPSQVPLGEMRVSVFSDVGDNRYEFDSGNAFTVPSLDPLAQDVGDTGAVIVPTTVTVFDNIGLPIPGALVDAYFDFFGSEVPPIEDLPTDVNGEVSFLSPMGVMNSNADVSATSPDGFYYGGGIARGPGTPLFIDLNSRDGCSVQGRAFDSFDEPLPFFYFYVEIYSGGGEGGYEFQEVLTDGNGDFSFDGVPGEMYIYGAFEGAFGADFIDNCRDVGPVRIIRRDYRFGGYGEFGEGPT